MRINWSFILLLFLIEISVYWHSQILLGISLAGILIYSSYKNVIISENQQNISEDLKEKAPIDRMKNLEKLLKSVMDHSRNSDKKIKDLNDKLANIDTRIYRSGKIERRMVKRRDIDLLDDKSRSSKTIGRVIAKNPLPEEKNSRDAS